MGVGSELVLHPLEKTDVKEVQGEETIVGVPTFRSALPVGGDRPMHRTVQEDNI